MGLYLDILADFAEQRLACSKRSDSGARAKNKASERAGKKRGKTGGGSSSPPVSPRFFPALSLALFFARAPLSERLEQAKQRREEVPDAIMSLCNKTSLLTRQGVAD